MNSPTVTISGMMSSPCSWKAHQCFPTRPKPTWTSSAINTPPASRTCLSKHALKSLKFSWQLLSTGSNFKRHPQKSKDCQHTNTIIWWASSIFLRRDNRKIFLCVCDPHKNQTLGPILTKLCTQVSWFIILDKFIIEKNHLNRFEMADILNTKTTIFLKKHYVS